MLLIPEIAILWHLWPSSGPEGVQFGQCGAIAVAAVVVLEILVRSRIGSRAEGREGGFCQTWFSAKSQYNWAAMEGEVLCHYQNCLQHQYWQEGPKWRYDKCHLWCGWIFCWAFRRRQKKKDDHHHKWSHFSGMKFAVSYIFCLHIFSSFTTSHHREPPTIKFANIFNFAQMSV